VLHLERRLACILPPLAGSPRCVHPPHNPLHPQVQRKHPLRMPHAGAQGAGAAPCSGVTGWSPGGPSLASRGQPAPLQPAPLRPATATVWFSRWCPEHTAGSALAPGPPLACARSQARPPWHTPAPSRPQAWRRRWRRSCSASSCSSCSTPRSGRWARSRSWVSAARASPFAAPALLQGGCLWVSPTRISLLQPLWCYREAALGCLPAPPSPPCSTLLLAPSRAAGPQFFPCPTSLALLRRETPVLPLLLLAVRLLLL